jgi:hypothetical protein
MGACVGHLGGMDSSSRVGMGSGQRNPALYPEGSFLAAKLQAAQSAGGSSTCQKFSGLSNATPSNHEAPLTDGTAATTLAFFLAPLETNSTNMGVSLSRRSWTITPQPCTLTTAALHSSRKLCAGSRLVMTTGICSERRVLRRASLPDRSTRGAPSPVELPSQPMLTLTKLYTTREKQAIIRS